MKVQQLDSVELTVLLVVLAAATAFGFYQGFRLLWKARVNEDAPTAKVRSAQQGYVELIGEAQAMRGEPIIAPLSKLPCCWYRYTIESKNGGKWRLSRKEVSDGLFLLRGRFSRVDVGRPALHPEIDGVHERLHQTELTRCGLPPARSPSGSGTDTSNRAIRPSLVRSPSNLITRPSRMLFWR